MMVSPGPPTRGERFAWCLFDFANSAFNTIVITFVYAAFFVTVLVGDTQRGDILWAMMLSVTGVVVAILSPLLGAMADHGAGKRGFLTVCVLICVAGTAGLFFPYAAVTGEPATETMIWTALCLVAVANIAFELGFVFYNAYLPSLGDEKTVGRLSGNAWALGYAGGLLCLVLCLLAFVGIGGNPPWVQGDANLGIRATNLLVAPWFLLFALPMLLWVKERPPQSESLASAFSLAPVKKLGRTLRQLRDYPDLLRLLVARLFYNDALIALIGLAALYMSGTLRMSDEDRILVAIWLNVAAGLGAFGFGHLDDKVGAKTVIVGSLVLLMAGAILAIAIPTVGAFWIASTLVGLGMGPNQAASRSLMARFVDKSRCAEFYGLFAMSGKATVWIGPLMFSVVRQFSDDQRLAFLPLIGLFVLGFVILLGVDETRGMERAARGSQPLDSTPEHH